MTYTEKQQFIERIKRETGRDIERAALRCEVKSQPVLLIFIHRTGNGSGVMRNLSVHFVSSKALRAEGATVSASLGKTRLFNLSAQGAARD